MDYERRVSLDEWLALLSIAHRYDFPRIRQRAIREVDEARPPLDAMRRLCFARKQQIASWLLVAYVHLCQRRDFVDDEDAEVLGLLDTARLARARERVNRIQWHDPDETMKS